MRCTNCNYPLWNLKARQCPECGVEFKPSEHEFLPNSVRFCCLQCDQIYYGTDYRGHLVPKSFTCVSCSTELDMDAMVLRPAEGVAEEQTRIDDQPWLERKQRGWIRGWAATVGRAMVSPVRLIRASPPEGSVGDAWWFALVTTLVVMFFGAGLPFLVIGLISALNGKTDWYDPLLAGAWVVGGGAAAILLIIAVWGLLTHFILVLTGGGSHGIGRTYQAVCYGAGANISTGLPCLGPYFSFVGALWWVISSIFMVSEGQRVSGGRATAAVLAFPALLIILAVAGATGAMFWGLGQARTAMQAAVVGQQEAECQLVLSALVDHERIHDAWPAHASVLTLGGGIGSYDFLAMNSDTFESDVVLEDLDLEAFAGLSDAERQEVVAKVVTAQPDRLAAHRVGDFVFAYHDVTLDDDTGLLWLVIMAADPESNESMAILGQVTIGRADGLVESILLEEFDARLEQQNELRVASGLVPLPAIDEITQAKAVLLP